MDSDRRYHKGDKLMLSPLTGNLGPLGMKRGTAFSPSSITGLLRWWKADAGTYQSAGGAAATADGDAVGQWQDQSSNLDHATQATANNKPTLKLNILNGLPALRFVSDDFLTHTYANPSSVVTIFAVARVTVADTFQGILSTGSAGAHMWANLDTPDKWGVFTGAVQVNSSYDLATARAVALVLRTNTDYDLITGGTVENKTTGNPRYGTASRIGDIANFRLTGDIHELLIYDTALSSTNRNLVGAYLAARWGVAWS
jgi:hypothetical protein